MAARSPSGSVASRLSGLPASLKTLVAALVIAGAAAAWVGISRSGCRAQDLGTMEEHLAGLGTVLVVGSGTLGRLEAPGARIAPLEEHEDVARALDGRDEAALVAAMEAADVDALLVASDDTDPQLMPEPTLRNLLSNYEPLSRLHAVYLSQAAGLFEVVEPWELSDEAGRQLVAIARAVMSGGEVPPRSELSAEVTQPRRDAEVALLIQGLRPLPRENSRTAHFVRRDYYVSRNGESLRDATIEAAQRLRERWRGTGNEEREGPLREALERLWVEVEVFYDRTPIAMEQGTLSEIAYRRYLWQAIELGVHGITGTMGETERFLLPSSAVYWARPDVRSFVERLARKLDLNGDGETDDEDEELYDSTPELRVERFRTFHFRELTPGGEVRRLRRGFVPLDEDAVSEESVRETVRLASRWLVDNLQEDGLFEYKYYPNRDIFYREFQGDEEDAHNIVRHALASYSLFMAYRELEDDELWEAAEASLHLLLDNTVIGPAWYSERDRRERLPEDRRRSCDDEAECDSPEGCIEGYCRLPFGAPVRSSGSRQQVVSSDFWESHDGYRRAIPTDIMFVRWKDVGKMGAAAATVMALTEMLAARPELADQYRPFLEGYAAFFLFMQRPDGSFNHYFTAPGDVRYYSTETSIYPGEILFALSRLYRLLGRQDLLDSFEAGHRYYAAWFRDEVGRTNDDGTYSERRRNDLVSFVPWMSMADNDMYVQTRRREHAEVGIEASAWIARRYQYDERRTYFPAYLGSFYRVWWEQPAMHGLVYTEGTAAAFNLARLVGDDEHAELLRRATVLGCRFAMQQTIRPGIDDHYLPGNRARVRSTGGVRFSLTVPDLRTDYTYHALSAMVQALRYFDEDDWGLR